MPRKALDIGLRELDKRHSRYRGIHLNVPREDWPNTLKILAERNRELTQGLVAAALVTAYDDKTRVCQLQFGNGVGQTAAVGMAMDTDFRQAGQQDVSGRRCDQGASG